MSDKRLGEELKRYGLEGMGGDPVDVLLRHIYANHEAALGAKDGTIASLESQNQALEERAEKAEAVMRKALEQHGDPDISCEDDCWAFDFKNALSPTQETDPTATCRTMSR